MLGSVLCQLRIIKKALYKKRLTFWAFHHAGVRAIWLPDGLGQPWPSIWPAIDTILWPTAPGEKWVVSQHAAEEMERVGAPPESLRVAGYLDKRFGGAPRARDRLRPQQHRAP